MREEEVVVLKLTLHDYLVGYLAGYQSGRNVLSFADEFRSDTNRPTFSLITHPNFPNAEKVMSESWARNQRLHPTLSNLLPEDALRALIAQALKVHINFAIKRFDRATSSPKGTTRIHMEDFAQVLVKYPEDKYSAANINTSPECSTNFRVMAWRRNGLKSIYRILKDGQQNPAFPGEP